MEIKYPRTTSGAKKSGVGISVPRWEDHRLLTGQGRFTDDHNMDGQIYAAFVRTKHSHEKIKTIDLLSAKAMEGVAAVFTAKDLEEDGVNVLPSDVINRGPIYPNKDGSIMADPPYFITTILPLKRFIYDKASKIKFLFSSLNILFKK